MIVVNDWKSLTIITKYPILDATAALDPPLITDKVNKKMKVIGLLRKLQSILPRLSLLPI